MISGRSSRTLMYSVEIFYYCYRTIENFLARAYYYCLCNFYQGCPTKCDCSIDELNTVKRDIFILTKFYFNLLDGLRQIKVEPDFNFWDDEVEFK